MVGITVIGAISFTAFCMSKHQSAKKILEEFRAKGLKTSFAELEPHDIPDSENAAILLEKAFPLLKRTPAENRLENTYFNESTPSSEHIEDLRFALQYNKEAFKYVDLALKLDKCKFDRNYSSPELYSSSHISEIRSIYKLLWYDAKLAAYLGDKDRAIDQTLKIFKLSDLIAFEPITLSYLVSIVGRSIGYASLHEIGQHVAFTTADVDRIVSAMNKIDLGESYHNALTAGRCYTTSKFEVLITDSYCPPDDELVQSLGGKYNDKLKYVPDFVVKLLFRAEFHEYLKYRKGLMEVEYNQYYDNYRGGIHERTYKFPWYCFTCTGLPGVYKRMHGTYAETVARERIIVLQMRANLLENADKLTFDDIAASIEDKEQLIDPFTGKNLKMVVDDGQVFFYSLGTNRKDEQGYRTHKRDDISFIVVPEDEIEKDQGE